MAGNEEMYLNSSTMREFRRVLEEDRVQRKMSKLAYGQFLKYGAQPNFNKITNGKSLPGLRAFIEIVEDTLGYEIHLTKKVPSNNSPTE